MVAFFAAVTALIIAQCDFNNLQICTSFLHINMFCVIVTNDEKNGTISLYLSARCRPRFLQNSSRKTAEFQTCYTTTVEWPNQIFVTLLYLIWHLA